MGFYSVAGRTTATAATADNFAGALWNPASTKTLWVVEIAFAKTVATVDNQGIVRISARGTVTTSATPDTDNAWDRDGTPATAAVLDILYSAQPTIAAPYLKRWNLPAAIGSGAIFTFPGPGIKVPAGTGLGVATPVAVILQPLDLSVTWYE
jgi:hypothetical protein